MVLNSLELALRLVCVLVCDLVDPQNLSVQVHEQVAHVEFADLDVFQDVVHLEKQIRAVLYYQLQIRLLDVHTQDLTVLNFFGTKDASYLLQRNKGLLESWDYAAGDVFFDVLK